MHSSYSFIELLFFLFLSIILSKYFLTSVRTLFKFFTKQYLLSEVLDYETIDERGLDGVIKYNFLLKLRVGKNTNKELMLKLKAILFWLPKVGEHYKIMFDENDPNNSVVLSKAVLGANILSLTICIYVYVRVIQSVVGYIQ